jgi:uncharacterized membrane protein
VVTRLKPALRALLALSMIGIGALHFLSPDGFVRIVPKALPAPLVLVYVSGVFEILGGAGLLLERTRRAAGIGLVLLYVAVFPANINMAVNEIQIPGVTIPAAALWLRLPFQILFIAWAWWCSRDSKSDPKRATTTATAQG